MHIQYTVVRLSQVTHPKGSGRGEAGQDTHSHLEKGMIGNPIVTQQWSNPVCRNHEDFYPGNRKSSLLSLLASMPLALREEITCAPRFLAVSFGRFFIVYYILWPDLKWMWEIHPFLVQRAPHSWPPGAGKGATGCCLPVEHVEAFTVPTCVIQEFSGFPEYFH